MTLRRQYQLGSDIFDTGPFAGYRGLGNGDYGNSSSNGDSSTTQEVDLSSAPAVIWSYENGLVDYVTAYNTLMNTFDYSDNDINDAMTYEREAFLLQYEAELTAKLEELDQGLEKENIVYTIWQDVYYANRIMELLTISEAKAILTEQFDMSAQGLNRYPHQWGSGMAEYNADSFLEQFERSDRELSLNDDYNPIPPPNNYAVGEYISPSVGNAVLADQPVPGGSYHYWDGNMDTHDWGNHGISLTNIVTGTDGVTTDGKPYPKPIVDAIGGYAMCISHYLADYDNATGAFNGFRVLTAAELGGGVPAGIPVATVMQMFTKCAETRSGKDFDSFTWTGANFYYDTEKNPIWRKSIGMPMEPASFFLLEPELALENKISKITWKFKRCTYLLVKCSLSLLVFIGVKQK